MEDFELKKENGIHKTVHAGYAKGSYQKLFFITSLLTFYAAYFITFMSNFYFALQSILNQCCLLF